MKPQAAGGELVRIALVAGPDPGHAFPAVALAIRLRDAGHDPLVLTGRRWLPLLSRDGVDGAVLPGLDVPAGGDTDAGARLHERAGEMAALLVERLAAERPDVVVGDVMTAAGGFAAELLGVPWVELVPHLLHLPSRALPPPWSSLVPGRTPIGRGRDRILRHLHARSVAVGEVRRRAVREALGLPAAQPDPAARLVATLPALEPARPDWPAATYVVGPLDWEPADRDLEPPAGDGPLVLVSASTASSGRGGVLEAALVAARELGLRTVATALGPVDREERRVRIGAGRQLPLLRAASVAVAGGGHGFVAKALGAGAPLVLVPGGGDQPYVAAHVARLGAGIVVSEPSGLTGAIRRVLSDPAYAESAVRIATDPGAGHPYADPVSAVVRSV